MIRGERVFTAKARAKVVRQFLKLAEKSMTEAERLHGLAFDIERAETHAELERIRLRCWSGDPLLDPYCYDDRTRCHYCKKMEFGGCSGIMLSESKRFCCWREECNKKFDRDIARDDRQHPKLYKAMRLRSKRRRNRDGRNKKIHRNRSRR